MVIANGLLWAHPRGSSTFSIPLSASKARARVGDGSSAKAARSSGVSTSSARPGRCSTVGRMPSASAARRCGKKLSSPKRSGTASGGEQITAFEPRSSRDGAIVKAGAGRCAAIRLAISPGVTRGISPGTVSMPDAPSSASSRAAADTAPVCPSRAPVSITRAPSSAASRAAAGSPSRPRCRRGPALRRAPPAHPPASPASAPAAAPAAAAAPDASSPDRAP